MTTKDAGVREKLDAIEVVVKALTGFEEGEANDIIAFARKHLGFGGTSAASTVMQPQIGGSTEGALQQPHTDNIAQFVGQKNPKNEYQRLAVLGYFLFKVRGSETFTLKDLAAANTEARQPKFSNISGSVNKALTRYKYLSQAGGRGLYSISFPGEQVVDALPNAEAVPVARARGKNGRKRTKAAKKQ